MHMKLLSTSCSLSPGLGTLTGPPHLSPHAWGPETIPVQEWANLAYPCFPLPVHSAFQTAPASVTRCPWRSRLGKNPTRSAPPVSGVFGKPRSCSATPPEVTAAVPWNEERAAISSGAEERRLRVRGKRSSGVQREQSRGHARGCSAEAGRRLGGLPTPGLGQWKTLGLSPSFLPSSFIACLTGEDPQLAPCAYLQDGPGRCVG